ncbi:hypothetical protein IVB12_16000 [Bradyrhizobium sp. 179]|uniref:hypothetical protein n=1 Tax=Bradyrhizobium sp. 179 TaxID=2782648 RepID=UPI001FF9BE0F|nr:hypothetical protein [Bradyrhizobium sp. 179]MCK1543420.1 hypothetical protein [Bradyrhizobium sp. 179]
MFIPNRTGKLSRKIGRNIYGETTWSSWANVPCAVVTNLDQVEKTPVRSDSSASRAAAEERVAVAKYLFEKHVQIGQDDKFEIDDLVLRVIAVQKRFSVHGVLDHLEVDFDIAP